MDINKIRMLKSHLTSIRKQDVSRFTHCQMKYDGWWCVVEIMGGLAKVYTAGCECKKTFVPYKQNLSTQDNPIWLLGEFIYGTNWAQSNNLKDRVVVFDMYFPEFVTYAERYKTMTWMVDMLDPTHQHLVPISTYPISEFPRLWKSLVVEGGFEGMVFRNIEETTYGNSMTIGRMKKTVSYDYVLMGVSEGGGRLKGTTGALICGLWQNGKLVSKVSVGGGMTDAVRKDIWEHRDTYVGRTVLVYGFSMFAGGSMRHPQFGGFRDDKDPKECVWPQKTLP